MGSNCCSPSDSEVYSLEETKLINELSDVYTTDLDYESYIHYSLYNTSNFKIIDMEKY
jgi:hypothetical protein